MINENVFQSYRSINEINARASSRYVGANWKNRKLGKFWRKKTTLKTKRFLFSLWSLPLDETDESNEMLTLDILTMRKVSKRKDKPLVMRDFLWRNHWDKLTTSDEIELSNKDFRWEHLSVEHKLCELIDWNRLRKEKVEVKKPRKDSSYTSNLPHVEL